MRPALLQAAVVVLLAAAPALAGALELMERAVLPSTPALTTCACAVPLREGEQLVVGLENGQLVSFHETAGRVIPRFAALPGTGPIDDIVACRVGRAAGSANEFALLVVRGRELFSVGFGDMAVAGSLSLPAPSGAYRFAKADPYHASHGEVPSAGNGADHPVLYDGDSVMSVAVGTRSLVPRVEHTVDGVPGVSVTALSDRVAAVAGTRMVEFPADGGMLTVLDERTDLADEPLRILIARDPVGGRTLELQVLDPDSVWVSRRAAAPGPISTAVAFADSLIAMGGTVPLTPSHDVGWVALVGPLGKVVALSDHASPVSDIAPVNDFIAVQGVDANLSIYDMNLKPLWDHDSPVTDAILLPGHFAGNEAMDLAVIGTRTYRVWSAEADVIRRTLDMPDFMTGAELTGGYLRLRRSFITFHISNEQRLERTLAEGVRDASDAFGSGRIDEAIGHATAARSAAAVLGDHERLTSLSSRMSEFASFAARRRSLLISAFVLAALGVWVAVESGRRTAGLLVSGAGALLLLVAGAGAWKLLGRAGLNPLLFAGGAIAAVSVVRTRMATRPVARVPGAAVEDLIRVLMEFLHGAGEGVPSDGVADTARKTVTKVAYLAQEMVDSMADPERYEMLRGRFRSRGDDFLDTTYPRVAVLLAQARRAGFLVHEAELMAAAADRMRSGIATILRGTTAEPPVLKQQLQAIKEGRDQLAAAADEAWAIVQTNPGCSLTRSMERILRERTDEFGEAGVDVDLSQGVPPEHDAVSLWAFEFRSILENLMTNAIRAMVSSRECVLTIETSTDGAMCTVRITDTGEGMDEETARAIFDAKGDGRDGGFGMPNSRTRLREHGGDMFIESPAPGPGTTVVLTIPHWTPRNGEADV